MTHLYQQRSLKKHIHDAIQAGGGFVGNKYFYNAQDNQTGGGIGGIFKSLFKFAAPLVKSAGKQIAIKAKDILEPEIKSLAKSGLNASERWLAEKVSKTSRKVDKKLNSIGRKRKRDTFDES